MLGHPLLRLPGQLRTAEFWLCGGLGSIPALYQFPPNRIPLIGVDGTQMAIHVEDISCFFCKQRLCGSRKTISSVLVISFLIETCGIETQFYFLIAFHFDITSDLQL